MNHISNIVQDSILSLNSLFKESQHKVDSWLAYLDNIQQHCQSVIMITQRAVQQSNQYVDQPMSTTFVTFHGSVKIMCEFIQNCLPKIKEHKSNIDEIVASCTLLTKETASELKQQCLQYVHSISKIMQSNYETCNYQQNCAQIGNAAHSVFTNFIEKTDAIKKKFKAKNSKNTSKLYEELVSINKILKDIEEILLSLFTFVDPREVDDNISKSFDDYRAEISVNFSIIKYANIVNVSNFETVPPVWQNTSNINPFYARVWADYNAKTPFELSVQKQEKVYVLKCGHGAYWEAQKSNNQRGFLPSYILEPVS